MSQYKKTSKETNKFIESTVQEEDQQRFGRANPQRSWVSYYKKLGI